MTPARAPNLFDTLPVQPRAPVLPAYGARERPIKGWTLIHLTPFAPGAIDAGIKDRTLRWREFNGAKPIEVLRATLRRLGLQPRAIALREVPGAAAGAHAETEIIGPSPYGLDHDPREILAIVAFGPSCAELSGALTLLQQTPWRHAPEPSMSW